MRATERASPHEREHSRIDLHARALLHCPVGSVALGRQIRELVGTRFHARYDGAAEGESEYEHDSRERGEEPGASCEQARHAPR